VVMTSSPIHHLLSLPSPSLQCCQGTLAFGPASHESLRRHSRESASGREGPPLCASAQTSQFLPRGRLAEITLFIACSPMLAFPRGSSLRSRFAFAFLTRLLDYSFFITHLLFIVDYAFICLSVLLILLWFHFIIYLFRY
jgi:hypothetical protein